MKRISSSDSLGALMSICPPTEEQSPRNTHMYSREFQSMLEGLDEEACGEEYGHVPEKKRRLSVDQVKALEKNFEVENKLEPERKVKLAQELGLQPRQVAVWFQNRRARWKTKQLERDYGVLKANYDSLKLNYDTLQSENDTLLKEIKELKSKLNDDNTESNISMKEPSLTESDIKPMTEPTSTTLPIPDSLARSLSFKEGPSDSDSSAILNEENNSPNAPNSSSSFRFNCAMSSSSPPSVNCCFSFSDSRDGLGPNTCQDVYQPDFVKMEEHNFFGGEEARNFFSDEQAPSLPWYSPDQFT